MDNKTIWMMLAAIGFLFIFGMPLFYLGVFNPATPQRAGGGEMGTATAGGYHVYNPLAGGGFIAFILGAIIFFWSLGDLRERIKANIPTILALIGIIFIFMSVYSLVAGLHDLLTFTAYETAKKPTFGQQYGWLIQFVVYGIIGVVLLYYAEQKRKAAGEVRSIIPTATSSIGAFLLLATFLLFVSGFHSFMYLTDYTEYRQSLAWVIETFVFGLMSYYTLKMSENINRAEGKQKSIFTFPTAAMGVIFMLMFLGVYIFGSFDWIYREYGTKTLNWFVEAIVFGALGVISSMISDNLSWKDGEESTGFPTSMYVAGVLLLLPAVILFLVGFNDFLYSDPPPVKWFYEFLFLAIPGVIGIAAAEYTRRNKRISIQPPTKKPLRRGTKSG